MAIVHHPRADQAAIINWWREDTMVCARKRHDSASGAGPALDGSDGPAERDCLTRSGIGTLDVPSGRLSLAMQGRFNSGKLSRSRDLPP